MHEEKDTGLPSESTVAQLRELSNSWQNNKFSSREGTGVRFFSSVSNLMNEVLINIMALINGERD